MSSALGSVGKSTEHTDVCRSTALKRKVVVKKITQGRLSKSSAGKLLELLPNKFLIVSPQLAHENVVFYSFLFLSFFL